MLSRMSTTENARGSVVYGITSHWNPQDAVREAADMARESAGGQRLIGVHIGVQYVENPQAARGRDSFIAIVYGTVL
jgi:hypothetical protein